MSKNIVGVVGSGMSQHIESLLEENGELFAALAGDCEEVALCERMKTAHNVANVARQSEAPCAPWRSGYDPANVKRGPVILDDDGEV